MNIFHQVKLFVKALLFNDNENTFVVFEGKVITKHDRYHLQVSKLPAINIKGNLVTGIHGISIVEFNREHRTPEYDGMLDETRVGFHIWMHELHKPYSWMIFANYVVYCTRNHINWIQVIKDHLNSMK